MVESTPKSFLYHKVHKECIKKNKLIYVELDIERFMYFVKSLCDPLWYKNTTNKNEIY